MHRKVKLISPPPTVSGVCECAAALELGGITTLYGGNGSGKTTLLNLMAEKLRLLHDFFLQHHDLFR